MSAILFITHPEVVIDRDVPITQWPLSDVGRRRVEQFAQSPPARNVRTVYSSTERKAMDGADIIARHLGLTLETDERLGENDRSSTGYIAPPEFWRVVDEFFARPLESVRGWEKAADAQSRVVAATREIAERGPDGDIAIVSHGGVASLLKAHLEDNPKARECAQPRESGGCYFRIAREGFVLDHGWRLIDEEHMAGQT